MIFISYRERGVRSIAVNPTNDAHILVATGRYSSGTSAGAATARAFAGDDLTALGESNWTDDVAWGDLHSSRDGGATWRTGPFRKVNRVMFAETNQRLVYVATADDGLFVSTNGTASFNRAPATADDTLWSAAVSPHDPSCVVLGTQRGGALVSIDGGRTWSRPPNLARASVMCAAFATSDPSTLLVGTDAGVFVSTDRGQTFAASNSGLVHRRILAALSHEADGFVVATDGGGIYARANPAHDWRQVYRGQARAGIGALVCDQDDLLYVGAGGTLCRTDDFGQSFQPLHHVLATIRAIGILASSAAPAGAGTVRWNRYDVCLIGAEDGSLHRSGDYGETWVPVLEHLGDPIRKIACAATHPVVVYAVVQGRDLYASRDDGHTWTALGASQYMPVTFALPEDQPDSIMIGTFTDGVLKSDDGGTTWRAVAPGLPATPVLSLRASVVSGERRLLAGLQGGGVWRYLDGAEQWVPCGVPIDNQSVNDICVHDADVLAATDTGVFRSTDYGATWTSYSEGLCNVRQVNRLALSRDGRIALCGELGGLYTRLVA